MRQWGHLRLDFRMRQHGQAVVDGKLPGETLYVIRPLDAAVPAQARGAMSVLWEANSSEREQCRPSLRDSAETVGGSEITGLPILHGCR